MISLLLPSRSRAQRAQETARKWLDNAGCDIEFILSIDIDDPQKKDYYNSFFLKSKIVCDSNRSAIDAINRAAKMATGNIIVQIAEDFDCTPLWGRKILEATQGKRDWILKTQDGIQKWIITLPIMDRAYYNRFGYVYHPDYLHMFCDTELSCVADLTGRKIESDILFPHNHYSTGKTQKDAIGEKADKTWEQGERTFIKRYKENFGLTETVGRIKDQNMINWILTK